MTRTLFRILIPAVILAAILFFTAGRTRSTGPASGTALIGSTTITPYTDSFKIATFNIDGGQGLDGKLDLTRTAKCLQRIDFIGLNEVHGFLFANPKNQAAVLAEQFHLPYLFSPAERRWWHDSFGNAIFTDLPVTHWQRIVLPSKPLAACRNYTLTEVRWHDQTIHILTTHVDWKTGGDEQLKIVSDVFLNLPEPAIFMGDLNHPPSDPQIQKLRQNPGVQEAIGAILDVGPNPEPAPRVDWIFLRGLKTLDAGSVNFGASDHPAFWAQITLKNAPTSTGTK